MYLPVEQLLSPNAFEQQAPTSASGDVGSRFSFCCGHEQIVLSFEGAPSSATEEGDISTLAVPHDSTAEEMKAAILSLAAESLDGYVGELDVSRDFTGAEGLQAYRYGRLKPTTQTAVLVGGDYDASGAGNLNSLFPG